MPQLPFKDKGPVEVVWDYDGTPLNLSPFLGTVSLRTTDTISEVQEEGYGETPIDAVFTGTRVELDVPMARSTLDQLTTLLAGVTSLAPNQILFSVKAGCDMYANALAIVIKPMCDGVPGIITTEWIKLYKCYPWREFDLQFDRDSQRIHMVKFLVFPSMESGHEGELYQYGV